MWKEQSCLWDRRKEGRWKEFEGLTQEGCKYKIFQHHIMIQEPLSLIKEPSLLPGKINGHIFKGYTALP